MSHHYTSAIPSRLVAMNTMDAEKIERSSHVRFPFRQTLTAPRGHTLLIGISSLVIPMSYNVITALNDTLVVNSITYTLTHGSPSAEEVAVELTGLLPDITVSFLDMENKFLFTSSNTITISPLSTCFTVLGFTQVTHQGTSLKSDNCIDLAGPRVLHLHSNLNVMSMDSRTMDNTSVLAVVPINAPHFSMLDYRGWELFQVSQTSIKILEFWLTDGLGQLIDLQGCDWSLTLCVSTVPSPEQIVATNILSRRKDDGIPSLNEKEVKKHRSHTHKGGKKRPSNGKEGRTRPRLRRTNAR